MMEKNVTFVSIKIKKHLKVNCNIVSYKLDRRPHFSFKSLVD